MDWNGDGKHDQKDDAFYNMEINKNGNNENNPPPNLQGCSPWIWDILSLGYLSLLLPGHIGVNTFTMFIGIICAGRIGYKILAWMYS